MWNENRQFVLHTQSNGQKHREKKNERIHLYWMAEGKNYTQKERRAIAKCRHSQNSRYKTELKVKTAVRKQQPATAAVASAASTLITTKKHNTTRNIRTLATAWCFQFTWWFSHFRFLFLTNASDSMLIFFVRLFAYSEISHFVAIPFFHLSR